MNKAKQERDWTVEPYAAKDFALFSDFEAELEHHLEEKMGLLKILWNADSALELKHLGYVQKIEQYEDKHIETASGVKTPALARKLKMSTSMKKASKHANASDQDGKEIEEEEDDEEEELTNNISREEITAACAAITTAYFGFQTRRMTKDQLARFQLPASMKTLFHEQRVTLFSILRQWTTGKVRSEVSKLKSHGVESARKQVSQLYAQEGYDDQQRLMRRLEQGAVYVTRDASGIEQSKPMGERDDVVEFFRKLEELRDEIRKRMPLAEREQHELTDDSHLVLYAKHGLHPQYGEVFEQMVNIKNNSSDIITAPQSLTDTTSDYLSLNYGDVKRAVLRRYQNISKTKWLSSPSAKRKSFNMYPIGMSGEMEFDRNQHKTLPDSVNPSGKIAHDACWSCSRPGCHRNKPECPHSNGLHFAPLRIKLENKLGAKPCMHFMTGHCKYGDQCNEIHPEGFQGALPKRNKGKGKGKGRGRGGHRNSGRGRGRGKGFTRQVAMVAAAVKVAMQDEEVSSDHKKMSKEKIAEEAFKAGFESNSPKKGEQQTTPQEDDSGLSKHMEAYMATFMIRQRTLVAAGGMESGTSIGIDTCSSVHVTSKQEDLIHQDRTADSAAISLGGVGAGNAQIIGAGLWIIPLQQVFVPDGDGYKEWTDAWLAAGDKTSSLLMKPQPRAIRILSDDMLGVMGLFCRNGVGPQNKSFLICKKTGCMIPTHRENGLLVIKTRKENPNKYSTNASLENWTSRLPSMLEYRMRGAKDIRSADQAIAYEWPAIARLGRNFIERPQISTAYRSLMMEAFTEPSEDQQPLQALSLVTHAMDFEAGAATAGTSAEVYEEEYSSTYGSQLTLLEGQSLENYQIDPEFTSLLMDVETKVQEHAGRVAIQEAWEDLTAPRNHEHISWDTMFKLLYDSRHRTPKQSAFVINPLRLTPEKRARLWHWRLAHARHDAPVRLTKSGQSADIRVTCTLNEDCPICDKAKFRRLPFTPMMDPKVILPPFLKCHVDEFGGQKSFKVATFHGAKSGVVFNCDSTDTLVTKLMSAKSQFEHHLRAFLISVLAKHWVCRIIIADGAYNLISDKTQAIAAEFGCVIRCSSPGTPQENRKSENSVRRVLEGARAMMLGAPHLPAAAWGCAVLYFPHVNEVIPKIKHGNKTPFTLKYNRPCDPNRMFIKTFGCHVQYQYYGEKEKPRHKMDERSRDGCFVGLEFPSALILDETNIIRRVSTKRIRCHEEAYCEDKLPSIGELRKRLDAQMPYAEKEHQEMPEVLPTIQSLRHAKDTVHAAGLTEQNRQQDRDEAISERIHGKAYVPEYAQIDILKDEVEQLQKEVTSLKDSGLNDELKQLLRDQAARDQDIRTRRTLDHDTPEIQGEPSDQGERTEPEGYLAPTTKKRKTNQSLIHEAAIGTRVKIKTTRFDNAADATKWSEGKPEYTYGNIVKQKKQKVVTVLWDGDLAAMDSHASHLDFENTEDANASNQTPHEENTMMARVLITAMAKAEHIQDPHLYYFTQALINTNGDLEAARTLEPYRSLAAVASSLEVDERITPREKYLSKDYPEKFPTNFLDALLKDDWRKWIEAYRKEWSTWELTNSFAIRKWEEMKKDTIVTRLYELTDIKKNGTYKVRPVLAGETMRKDLDYGNTFARTASSDTIRFIVSFNVSVMGSPLWAGDVSCAFLQAKNNKPVYCYKPSWFDYIHQDWDQLAQLRRRLTILIEQRGKSAVKKMITQTRGRVKEVLECISAVYGNPAATRLWSIKNDEYLSKICGLKKSIVEPCLYYTTLINSNPTRRKSMMVTGILIVGVHVDDLLVSGTKHLKEQFKERYTKACGGLVNWQIPATEFTSMEIKQDTERGYVELTQSKYWESAGKRFSKYLPAAYTQRIPVKPKTVLEPPKTEAEWDEAKNLPYRELVGTLNYPAQMTKFEIQFAVQQLSKHMQRWSKALFDIAVGVLMYGITTRSIGLIYSRGLDPHGINVLSAYADATFNPGRPVGSRILMHNGAIIRSKSAQHSVTADSTCSAEAVEAALAANGIAAFRYLVKELGFKTEEPTVLHQDNQAAIQVAEGFSTSGSSSGSKARHIMIRVAKLAEYITDKEITLKYCRTVQMLADLGTKFHPVKTFEFLRDMSNGYALVKLRNDGYIIPELVYTLKENDKIEI